MTTWPADLLYQWIVSVAQLPLLIDRTSISIPSLELVFGWFRLQLTCPRKTLPVEAGVLS